MSHLSPSEDEDLPVRSQSYRWWVARGLLALATVLYILGLVLPVADNGKVRGKQALSTIAQVVFEEWKNLYLLEALVLPAILLATGMPILVAMALLLKRRFIARWLAVLLLILAWALLGTLLWFYRDDIYIIPKLFVWASGQVAWYFSLITVSASAFVWPRPGALHDDDLETLG